MVVALTSSEPSAAIDRSRDRESSLTSSHQRNGRLFLLLLPVVLSDAHELSVLAATLRTSRR